MSAREEAIAERADANLAEFFEHGPGLRFSTRSWILARGDDAKILRGGLGGFGHGRMWGTETDRDKADLTYAEAPYAPETRDDFGGTGYPDAENERIVDAQNLARNVAESVRAEAYRAVLERLLADPSEVERLRSGGSVTFDEMTTTCSAG